MNNTLLSLVFKIDNPELHATCIALVEKPQYAPMGYFPASLSWHHNYEGGLVAHTVEVCEIGLHIGSMFPEFNKDIFIAAALWHDLAKIWDYELRIWDKLPQKGLHYRGKNYWVQAEYQSLIYHINGSHAEFVSQALVAGVSREDINAVSHAILAHHGPVKEWGSPVAPQTLEALVLHQADMLSSKFAPRKNS